jgi:hypothetical protein
VLLIAMPIVGYIANSAYGADRSSGCSSCADRRENRRSRRHCSLSTLGGLAPDHLVLIHVQRSAITTSRDDNVMRRMLPRAGRVHVAGPYGPAHSAAAPEH